MKIKILYLIFIIFISSQLMAYNSQDINNYCFIENKGQFNSSIKYVAYLPNMNVIIDNNSFIYDFYSDTKEFYNSSNYVSYKNVEKNYSIFRKGQVIDIEFEKSNTTAKYFRGVDPSPFVYHYFVGEKTKWATNVKAYNSIAITNLYKGIDAVMYLDNGKPRYDLICLPSSEINDINLRIKGASVYKINSNNDIEIETQFGTIYYGKVYAYQYSEDTKKKIECKFVMKNQTIGFEVGSYDKTKPLVIDPIIFSTYFGGAGDEEITDATYYKNGELIVCGWTNSLDFQTTPGAYNTEYHNEKDAFVSKFLVKGSDKRLIFSTYIGGADNDQANGIKVDNNGNIYFTGITSSRDFPLVSSFSTGYRSGVEGFITKLKPDGSDLLYSNLYGGTKDDYSMAITLDQDNFAYIVGYTNSTDIPIASTPYQATKKGVNDVFVAKISENGKNLAFSTYIGGSNEDRGFAIDIDNSKYIFITGETMSGDFPIAPYRTWGQWVTEQPFDYSYNGAYDAFVLCLIEGGSLKYSTYFGGSADERGTAVAAGNDGTVYFGGWTRQETSDPKFPISEVTFQTTHKGGLDCFLAQLEQPKKSGQWGYISQAMVFSTFLGGSNDDYLTRIYKDANTGYIVLSGKTNSGDFPSINSQIKYGGRYDMFLTKFTPKGGDVTYSSFFGGNNDDWANGIAYDERSDYYICGGTSSSILQDLVYPIQSLYGGGKSDALIYKDVTGTISITQPSGNEEYCSGGSVTINWTASGINPDELYTLFSYRDSKQVWDTIVKNYKGTSYKWNIPSTYETGNDYHVVVTHSTGLMSTNYLPFSIFKPISEVSITSIPEDLTICEGSEVTFQALVSETNVTYQWYMNDKQIPNANGSQLKINPVSLSSAGKYSVIAKGKCPPDVKSNEITLNVIPATEILKNLKDTIIKKDENITLSITAKGQNLSYEWYFNSSKLLGVTTPEYVILSAQKSNEGLYKCIVNGTCGKVESYEAHLEIDTTSPSSVEDYNNIPNLSLNTSCTICNQDILKLTLVSDIFQNVKVRVINVIGNVVYENNYLDLSYGNNELEIDFSSLPSGNYWIIVQRGAQSIIKKLNYVK